MAVCCYGGEMLLCGSPISACKVAGRRLCSLGKVPGSLWVREMLSLLQGSFTSYARASSDSPRTAESLKPYTNGSGLLMDEGPGAVDAACCASPALDAAPPLAPAPSVPVPCLWLPLPRLRWWCPGDGLCWEVSCCHSAGLGLGHTQPWGRVQWEHPAVRPCLPVGGPWREVGDDVA